MKYCMKCGTPNDNDQSRFCHKCGAEFPNQYVQAPASAVITPSPNLQKKKKLFIGIAAIVAALVLALSIMLAAGVFSNIFNPSDSDDEEAYSSKDRDQDEENEEEDKEEDEQEDEDDSGSSGKSNNGLFSGFFGGMKPAETEESPIETLAPEPTSAPFDGAGQLSVWSSDERLQTILDYAKSDMPNLQCEFLSIPYDTYNDKLRVSMAAGDAPDVFTLDHPYPKTYMDLGVLLDLTDLEREAETNGTMRYTIEYGRDSYGTLRALAWQVNPGGMFYRRSLAVKYFGTDDPDEVQSMFSNVNKMYESAEILHNSSNGQCKLTSSNDLTIPSLSLRSNPWVTNGSLTIDDNLVNFLDIYKGMYQLGYLATCRQWDESWFSSFNDGMTDENANSVEIFSYFFPKWGLEYVIKQNAVGKNDTTEDWAMINGPFSYFMGGSWICADNNTDSPEAAKALIQYITLNEVSLERWARETKDIVPNVSVNNMVKQDGMDPFVSGQDLYSLFNDISQNIDGTLYTQYDQQIESLWVSNVENYLSGQVTLDEAVETFRNDAGSNIGIN